MHKLLFLTQFINFVLGGCAFVEHDLPEFNMLSVQETTFEFTDDQTVISATFENTSSETVGLFRCAGGPTPVLQKKVGVHWRRVYEPLCRAVLLAPLAVEPGGVQALSLKVVDVEDEHPEFKASSRAGVYRLAMRSIKGYNALTYPFSDPETAWMVSNVFTIR